MGDRGVTIEELDETACAELLGAHHFGRIAVMVDGSPVIFPVNYLYQDGRVAIRTDPGTKLTGAAMGSVAFEIDEVDALAKEFASTTSISDPSSNDHLALFRSRQISIGQDGCF